VDASGHDGGLRNGGSPDSEAAACISNDDMCKSLGLPSPCWYCPPGFLKKCASTALGDPLVCLLHATRSAFHTA
jgi:hypothetical protein